MCRKSPRRVGRRIIDVTRTTRGAAVPISYDKYYIMKGRYIIDIYIYWLYAMVSGWWGEGVKDRRNSEKVNGNPRII